MEPNPAATIAVHFSKLADPRRYNSRHLLHDIIVMAVCAAICGADDWVAVADFGRAKHSWFAEFLKLPHGIPSHDTFGDVFRLLDPEQFRNCFIQWVSAVNTVTAGQVVPIDGKKLRRSHDHTLGKAAIHMVSAWAAENHVVLGQVKVDAKSNEITAIPQLLDLLEISGGIVTIDAMGCQKAIARKIVKEKHADYVLAVKANQAGLFADVQDLFARAQEQGNADCGYYRTEEHSHGRHEIRECWTLSGPQSLSRIRDQADWCGLQTVIRVKSTRGIADQQSTEERYYIASLAKEAQPALSAVRGHWGIENKVHWVLDIAFREDECRIRKGNGAQNFAILRHIALNLLKQEQTAQCGIKNKRLKAGWDESYLLKVLHG